jgi:ribonuclease HI
MTTFESTKKATETQNGKAKNHWKKPKDKSDKKRQIEEYVASLPDDATLIFTDGGCDGNPGPCGAGMLACLPDWDGRDRGSGRYSRFGEDYKVGNPDVCFWVWRHESLGHGTNNIAELHAVSMALDLCLAIEAKQMPEHQLTTVHILSDSTYTVGMLSLGWRPQQNKDLVLGIREKWDRVKATLILKHVPAHCHIPGNDFVDELATRATRENKT